MRQEQDKNRVNHQIRVPEVRLIGADGENLGVVGTREALQMAEDKDLDLIEISSKTNPPIAKIADYGKFQYAEKKKLKEAKQRNVASEMKVIQIKIGTGDHDLELKAKRISEWLSESSRIKIDLFLPGRTKYMDKKFLEERFNRLMKFVTEPYKIVQNPLKSPKGLTMVIDKQ